MSDGAIDIAAGLGLGQRLLHQHRDRLVVEDAAVLDQPVMAVAGEGIERDVAEHADVGNSFLIARTAWQTRLSGIERFRALLVAQRRLGEGEQRDARDVQLGGALGIAHDLVDGEPIHARHRGHRRAGVAAVHHEHRPDQVVGGQHVLAHQARAPIRDLRLRRIRIVRSSEGEARASVWRRGVSRSSIGRPNLIAMIFLPSADGWSGFDISPVLAPRQGAVIVPVGGP